MKRIALLASSVLSMVLSFPGYALAEQAQERAKAPVYRDGDWWQLSFAEKGAGGTSTAVPPSGIYELVYNNGNINVYLLEGQNKEPADDSRRYITKVMGMRKYYGAHLRFPLFVGKKWDVNYRGHPRGYNPIVGGPHDFTYHAEVNVVGMEDITVPAGTFRAFKIDRWDTFNYGSSTGQSIYYFSPATKTIVKYHHRWGNYEQDIELLRFGSGTPSVDMAK